MKYKVESYLDDGIEESINNASKKGYEFVCVLVSLPLSFNYTNGARAHKITYLLKKI